MSFQFSQLEELVISNLLKVFYLNNFFVHVKGKRASHKDFKKFGNFL